MPSLAAGVYTCAVRNKNEIYCWGFNYAGQLGIGTREEERGFATPQKVTSTIGEITALAAGDTRTCALLANGDVYCWGNIDNCGTFDPRFGDPTGPVVTANTPTKIAGLTNIKKISTGRGHTCAVDSTNILYCFGLNDYGQVGNGESRINAFPVAINIH